MVDDEPDARDLVTAVLSRSGARVRTASSVDEAIERLREHRPDALLSDIGLRFWIFGGRSEVRRIERPAGDRSGILAQRFDHLLAIAREDDPRRRLVCLQRGRHHVEGDDAAARMVDDENHSRFVQ